LCRWHALITLLEHREVLGRAFATGELVMRNLRQRSVAPPWLPVKNHRALRPIASVWHGRQCERLMRFQSLFHLFQSTKKNPQHQTVSGFFLPV
jgi:hypothetical protein